MNSQITFQTWRDRLILLTEKRHMHGQVKKGNIRHFYTINDELSTQS